MSVCVSACNCVVTCNGELTEAHISEAKSATNLSAQLALKLVEGCTL